MALFTLAFPNWPKAHADWAEAHRQAAGLPVAPHFTFVFGVTDVPRQTYLDHIANVASQTCAIDFHCRHIALWTDHRDTSGYGFLVPDQGNSAMYALHNALYSGPLAHARKLDVPFVPHLTLQKFPDLIQAKAFCEAENAKGLSIKGQLNHLAVIDAADGQNTEIARFDLQ